MEGNLPYTTEQRNSALMKLRDDPFVQDVMLQLSILYKNNRPRAVDTLYSGEVVFHFTEYVDHVGAFIRKELKQYILTYFPPLAYLYEGKQQQTLAGEHWIDPNQTEAAKGKYFVILDDDTVETAMHYGKNDWESCHGGGKVTVKGYLSIPSVPDWMRTT